MAKKWIKKALEGAHGQFKAKAERAGESTSEFAKEHEHDSGKLGKQARLAQNLMKMHHGSNGGAKKKKIGYSNKEIMSSMYGKE